MWMRGCDADYGSSTVTGGPFPDDTVAPISMLFGPRAPIEYAPGQFTGWIDQATGQRVDYHYGIDIAPPAGTPLVALGYGKVTQVIVGDPSFGNAVKCEYAGDDGHTYAAMYLHMADRALVTVGDTVAPGQVLGYVGTTGASSGPHLHMQVWRNDFILDPLALLVEANPLGFVPPPPVASRGALPALTRVELGAALVDEANVHGILVTRDEAALANAETYRVNILRDESGRPI